MTLDEAIQHSKEVAKKEKCNLLKVGDDYIYSECAMEHEQLAEWLKELKEYKRLEKQKLLKKYDCAIGDTVYRINSLNEIYECTVQGIRQEFNTISYFLHANINEEDYSIWVDNWFDRCQIGYEFYLTKEKAEQELKRLESAE